MGQILRYVVSHEVGHTLGLRHNYRGSSTFSIAELRSPKWTNEWGDESSIMDYGRFNYVAQPGDGARLIPKQGPYDYFAIEWGYKPIDGAKTPDEERAPRSTRLPPSRSRTRCCASAAAVRTESSVTTRVSRRKTSATIRSRRRHSV